ncbi:MULTISPECIES: metallophosphoesterase [Anaerococcus]|jgi:metallophosphoesterase|uniref:metallophosphoesterase n=1 Tax=Anaerococcus TaxID=165779 RepID=UPI002901D614|nr:metallophosphoesterase [Anaerococcus sp.]MDU2565865.1 metallophosphoesterase [Anaerococcus sp.]
MNNKNKVKLGTGLIVAGILIGAYIDKQCFVAKEEKVILKSEKIKNPIRITQISDFHSNAIKNLDELLINVKDFDPDFIILTGDMIDYGTDAKIDRSLYFLKKLAGLNKKIFYITGNHEETGPNLDRFLFELEKLGIVYLYNECYELNIRNQDIYLYGTSMLDFSYKNYKPKKNSINVILSHYSKIVRDNYIGNEDFIFSGHTHGGQVRMPIIGGLIAPGEGVLPNYDKGVFNYKDSIIYVDSGLGNTFLPLRFLDQIEYSNITLAPIV